MKYEIKTEADERWAKETYWKQFEATITATRSIRKLRKAITGLREAAMESGTGYFADKLLSHAVELEKEHNWLVEDCRKLDEDNTDLYLSIYAYERSKEDGNNEQMDSDPGSDEGSRKTDDAVGADQQMAV